MKVKLKLGETVKKTRRIAVSVEELFIYCGKKCDVGDVLASSLLCSCELRVIMPKE